MDNVALFFHLLEALVFVAGIVLVGTAFETARRRKRPAEIALLLGVTRVGVLLVATAPCSSESSGYGSYIWATSATDLAGLTIRSLYTDLRE